MPLAVRLGFRVFALPSPQRFVSESMGSSPGLQLPFRGLPGVEPPRSASRNEASHGRLPWALLPYSVSPLGAAACWPGLPHPTACASRFSQPPGAFIRSEPAGLVSCQIRSWGSPFRALLLPRSRTSSPRPFPSCRSLARSAPQPGPQRPPTLLRKSSAPLNQPYVKPCETSAAFRGLLYARVRDPPWRFRPNQTRGSLGLFPLQGVLPRENGPAFTAPPLMRLSDRAQATSPTHYRVLLPAR
jgi:hypothetical protein